MSLSLSLPSGRIVVAEESDGEPALWMSDGPAPYGLWARLRAEHPSSGLWPLLLESLGDDEEEFRPWASGELDLSRATPPERHDAAALLARGWRAHLPEEEELQEVIAPYGSTWPGPAPAGLLRQDPDVLADDYADVLRSFKPSMRLGLVAAGRGADALAAAGWTGPLNYTGDTGEISAVLRDWERRFGARVVGTGFADLYLSVAAPPATLDQALHVAAEHFAFCPDNIWQGPGSLAAYAECLVDEDSWRFWWD